MRNGTRNEIVRRINFLNHCGYNPISEIPKFQNNKYDSLFDQQFRRDISAFYHQHNQDLIKHFNLPHNFIIRIFLFINNHIPEYMFCEYDSVFGYVKIIKLFKERFCYD